MHAPLDSTARTTNQFSIKLKPVKTKFLTSDKFMLFETVVHAELP